MARSSDCKELRCSIKNINDSVPPQPCLVSITGDLSGDATEQVHQHDMDAEDGDRDDDGEGPANGCNEEDGGAPPRNQKTDLLAAALAHVVGKAIRTRCASRSVYVNMKVPTQGIPQCMRMHSYVLIFLWWTEPPDIMVILKAIGVITLIKYDSNARMAFDRSMADVGAWSLATRESSQRPTN